MLSNSTIPNLRMITQFCKYYSENATEINDVKTLILDFEQL